MKKHWSDELVAGGACEDAVAFARGYRSFTAAWRACERPDWLLWWAGKCISESGSEAHRTLVRVSCQCARTVLHLVPKGEDRPRVAIETAEAWCEGTASLAEVRSAASDAAVASDASAAASDASAADAARLTKRRELCDLIRHTYPTPPRAKG